MTSTKRTTPGQHPPEDETQSTSIGNDSQLLVAKLYFRSSPDVNDQQLNQLLIERLGNVTVPDVRGNVVSRFYVFNDHVADLAEKPVAAQGVIVFSGGPDLEDENLQEAVRQSWGWEEAADVVQACHHELIVTDMMARSLTYADRLDLFQRFLHSVVDVTLPDAIYLVNGNVVTQPASYLETIAEQGYLSLNNFVNIRYYTVRGQEGVFLMDTLGMASLGLPDFELIAKTLTPQVVGTTLFNLASYTFENGVVIAHGDTIPGPGDVERMQCWFAEASVPPERILYSIEKPQPETDSADEGKREEEEEEE